MKNPVKFFNIHSRSMFIIPKKWRNELNIQIGDLVKIERNQNHIIIENDKLAPDCMVSIIGRDGTLYLPAEVRQYFLQKGIEEFKVTVDRLFNQIILSPIQA
ncbi:AbrB/MazE/SpoVT family DNA-binding domain-containing protein [Pseudalkalibacillus sp. SCS-8]|uniref:AbrB/MazE/SpoVT family DNA-binding domain-containing protein n=1 Tax=Pseudalkalibacillus nanhaiensis TaxID=3115291 RepID=UPI0032DBBD22